MSRQLITVRRCATAAVLVGAIGVGVPAASSARSAHRASVAACSSASTDTWIDTSGNGAAGTIFFTLYFTNLSGSSCTLRGYPGLSPVNLRGGRVGAAATRDPHAVKLITIRAGGTATATVGVTDTGVFTASTCRPVTAAGFKVFAPNETTGRFVPFPVSVCSRGASSLRIGPVTR